MTFEPVCANRTYLQFVKNCMQYIIHYLMKIYGLFLGNRINMLFKFRKFADFSSICFESIFRNVFDDRGTISKINSGHFPQLNRSFLKTLSAPLRPSPTPIHDFFDLLRKVSI